VNDELRHRQTWTGSSRTPADLSSSGRRNCSDVDSTAPRRGRRQAAAREPAALIPP
jgi:hypothetical protein